MNDDVRAAQSNVVLCTSKAKEPTDQPSCQNTIIPAYAMSLATFFSHVIITQILFIPSQDQELLVDTYLSFLLLRAIILVLSKISKIP